MLRFRPWYPERFFAVLILALAARPGQEVRLISHNLTHLYPKMMGNILRIGIPSAFESCLFQLGRVVVVSMIALFGTTQTSANAVANNLDTIGIIIGQAMGLAMITVVGQCMGAGEPEQAVRQTRKLMCWVYVAQGLSNLLVIVCLPFLIGCYRSLSPETAALARTLVLIHSGSALVLWPVAFVLPNAAGGRGRAVYHGGECGVYGLVADRLFLDFVCEAGIWGHWCMDCHGIGLDLQNRLFPGTFSLGAWKNRRLVES